MFIEVTKENEKKVSLNAQYIKYFNSNSEGSGAVIVLYTTSSSDLSVIKVKESYTYLLETLKSFTAPNSSTVDTLKSEKVEKPLKTTKATPRPRTRTPKKPSSPTKE